jgi:hypothetical protein
VRICDWDAGRADDQGRFKFARLSPGKFLVRAEYPGGEFQEELNFTASHELRTNLQLTAVTTVGIRWAVQQREGSRQLVGARACARAKPISASSTAASRSSAEPKLASIGAAISCSWTTGRACASSSPRSSLLRSKAQTQTPQSSWLFDATRYPTGLHAERVRFEDIRAINEGQPYDDKSYFTFLRGEMVRKGQVYTLRCVRKDCYAKLEITDVTVVPKSPE